MTSFQKLVIDLIDASLYDKKININLCDIDFNQLYTFCKKQQLMGIIYNGLLKVEGFSKSIYWKQFLICYSFEVSVSERQMNQLQIVYDYFNKNNIEYLPLKGCLLKNIYPHPEMRVMGDADILIHIEDFDKCRSILKELGFIYKLESDHEFVFEKKDVLFLELHKHLIPSYNKDYYKYFGDGWKFVKNNKMSIEDNFIYLFTHFAKHYRDAGVGLKYLIDFYVYTNHYKILDFVYIENKLKELNLYLFYKNVLDTIDVCFKSKIPNDITKKILGVLFDCNNVYGSKSSTILSEGLKAYNGNSNVKTIKYFRLFFPKYKMMCNKYKFLKYLPFLLPIMYIIRLISYMFSFKKIKNKFSSINKMTEQNIIEYKKQLNDV